MIRSVAKRRILTVAVSAVMLSLLVCAEPIVAYAENEGSIEQPVPTTAETSVETGAKPIIEPTAPDNADLDLSAIPTSEQVVKPVQQMKKVTKTEILPQTRVSSPKSEITTPVTTPPLIVTAFNTSTKLDFFEFYNQSDAPINIGAAKRVVYSDESLTTIRCETAIGSGWLLANHYLAIGSGTGFSHHFSNDCAGSSEIHAVGLVSGGSRIQLIDHIEWQPDSTWAGHTSLFYATNSSGHQKGQRKSVTSAKQTGNFSDYTEFTVDAQLLDSGELYTPPKDSGLKIVEIFPDSRSCLPGDTSGDCFDFVKLRNTSTHAIDLAQFRMRVGSRDASASITTSYTWQNPTLNPERDELLLPAGQLFLLRARDDGQPLSLSNASGNVWIEDYYGIQSYDAVSYAGMDKAAASGKSWVFDENSHSWQFGAPSPFGANRLFVGEPGRGSVGAKKSDLKPCRIDQYRSTETNRCRNKASGVNSLVPCKAGQYRSEETNRCRSTASAASTLKACASNQIRNLETNRCRKVAVASSSLTPCAKGKERNPETNRCRKVVTSAPSNTAFAPEPIKQSAKSFIGWWALGGITLFAAGYGAWEWRQELRRGLSKVAQIFSSKQ